MDRPGRCELEVGSTIEKKPLPIICLKVLNDPKLILLDHLKDHSEPLGVKNKKLGENSFSDPLFLSVYYYCIKIQITLNIKTYS